MKIKFKSIVISVSIMGLLLGFCATVYPQNNRKLKAAAKANEIKNLIDSGRYMFNATYAHPLRGGTWTLTSEYNLKIQKDSVIAWLPYFGRAFSAPVDPTDGGIHFTSTKFSYKVVEQTKGGWEVTIKPSDVKDVEQLFLDIGTDGYANLHITLSDRDAIMFDGNIEKANSR